VKYYRQKFFPIERFTVKFSLKSAVALLAASTLPLIAVAPASAVELDRLNFTVDCLVGETGSEDNHTLIPGETLVVTLANCAGYYVEDDKTSGLATLTGGIVLEDEVYVEIPAGPATITIVGSASGAADIEIHDLDDLSMNSEFDIDIDIETAGTVADPESTLLVTEEMVVALDAEEMMVNGEVNDGDILLGANEACRLELGLHVYETLDLTITEAGVYDFRAIAVNPFSSHLYWGLGRTPSSDTFLAVYDNFDPANPNNGVVGCNDDADGSGVDYVEVAFEENPALVTEAGDLINDRFPWFQSELAAGEYTLVLMFYQTAGTDNFSIGEYGTTSEVYGDTWDPAPQSATFEMWGPAGGLELGHTLADTGVDPAFALWSGLALAGTGVAITAARRRAQRA
jgi:hypothetical protein